MAAADLPTLAFETEAAWHDWLERNHAVSPGVWIRFAKKASGEASITHDEALDAAIAYGWIDGQNKSLGATHYVQRFIPRAPRSKWSRINGSKAEALIASGQMRPAGLREVERAKADGRWAAAYEGPRLIPVPDDLREALDASPRAAAFFEGLDSKNRYAVLYRIHDAKKPETRARRIANFVGMLAEGRKLHP